MSGVSSSSSAYTETHASESMAYMFPLPSARGHNPEAEEGRGMLLSSSPNTEEIARVASQRLSISQQVSTESTERARSGSEIAGRKKHHRSSRRFESGLVIKPLVLEALQASSSPTMTHRLFAPTTPTVDDPQTTCQSYQISMMRGETSLSAIPVAAQLKQIYELYKERHPSDGNNVELKRTMERYRLVIKPEGNFAWQDTEGESRLDSDQKKITIIKQEREAFKRLIGILEEAAKSGCELIEEKGKYTRRRNDGSSTVHETTSTISLIDLCNAMMVSPSGKSAFNNFIDLQRDTYRFYAYCTVGKPFDDAWMMKEFLLQYLPLLKVLIRKLGTNQAEKWKPHSKKWKEFKRRERVKSQEKAVDGQRQKEDYIQQVFSSLGLNGRYNAVSEAEQQRILEKIAKNPKEIYHYNGKSAEDCQQLLDSILPILDPLLIEYLELISDPHKYLMQHLPTKPNRENLLRQYEAKQIVDGLSQVFETSLRPFFHVINTAPGLFRFIVLQAIRDIPELAEFPLQKESELFQSDWRFYRPLFDKIDCVVRVESGGSFP